MTFRLLMAAAAMPLTLAACNMPPQYTPPSNLTAQEDAGISGSTIETGSIFSPNTTVDLWSIDNQVAYGRKTPVLVTPGTHIVTAYICQCGELASNISGNATLMGNFKAGENYTIRTTVPTNAPGVNNKFVTVWIEDSKGVPITPQNKFEISVPLPPIAKLFTN